MTQKPQSINNLLFGAGILVVMFLLVILLGSSNPANNPQRESLSNIGSVYAVGVGLNTTRIDWGILDPNSTATRGIQVTNTGNTPSWLNFNVSNYQPQTLRDYMTLTWSYLNETLQPLQTIDLTLTLGILSAIHNITQFSFDITITGNGY